MILIAESGSTKCNWVLCHEDSSVLDRFETIGFNPYFINSQLLNDSLESSGLSDFRLEIVQVFFYGSGCSSNDKKKFIQENLSNFFLNATVNVNHDLDAACFSLFSGVPNITCILGTGSNSCLYNGKDIIESAPSLGFIVGDEASGSYFGKKILNLYYNNKLGKELSLNLENKFETDINIVHNKIYNNDMPNSFLASYFPFIIENKKYELIHQLIYFSLNEFFDLHIKCFENHKDVEVNFVGSVAFYLSEEIRSIAENNNITIGRIIQRPIDNLLNYHFN